MTAKIMGALDAGMNFAFGLFNSIAKKIVVLVVLTALATALVVGSLMSLAFVALR